MFFFFITKTLEYNHNGIDGSENYTESKNKKQGDSKEANESLREIIDNLAEIYIIRGDPILAACSHLSINDPSSAVLKLLRANEISFAYALALIFKLPQLDHASWMLAKRAERFSERYLGQQLLKQVKSPTLLPLYCVASANSNSVLDDLYKQV